MEKILAKWMAFSKTQKTTMILCTILALILMIGAGIVIASLGENKDAMGTESTEGSESLFAEEVFGEATEATETTEVTEMEVIETVTVSLTASSIEKDLKIKILDENDVRIKGQPFVITVTPEGASEGKEYNDHDMDGIIYMKSMTPGKYTVQLHELEGFVPVENPITATVKDQIVYEKVDVSNEIKDESEISETEKAPDNGESTQNQIKDTLTYLESDVKTDEVTKDKVDISAFAEAKASTEKHVVVLENGSETAELALPKTATLYTSGKDTAKTLLLELNVTDATGIVTDIQWQLNGNAIASTVADNNMSATLTMKEIGTAKVLVVVTYEQDSASTDSSEGADSAEGSEGSETPEGNSVGLSANMGELPSTTTKTVTLECTVSVENQPDNQTQLKDTSGNLLYLDDEAKTPATPASYVDAEKFYANPKYVGWHELDGKSYYYKEDGTPATGKQIIGGVEYEFDESGYLITKERSIGIDVSKWNKEIDWEKVANDPAGIEFAIIRCGNRYGKTGAIAEDPYFKQNIEGAIKNGIKVGVYFYSQAITKAEAVEEASAALELVKGYNLQLPIYIDTEHLDGGRANALSKEERTEILITFCEVIKNAGYKPGVYSGAYWYKNHVDTSKIEQYHIWVAQYRDELTYQGRYDIWQYTSDGSVSGIKGRVDMNIAYRTYY